MNREHNSNRNNQAVLTNLSTTIANSVIANTVIENKSVENEELEQAGKAALTSLQALTTQFLAHQQQRQNLEKLIESILSRNSDAAKSPIMAKLQAQIIVMLRTEEAIAATIELLPPSPFDQERGQALLAPLRDPRADRVCGTDNNGDNIGPRSTRRGNDEDDRNEGFYFPRR